MLAKPHPVTGGASLEATESMSAPFQNSSRRVLMLLANHFAPDPRVHSEARSLTQHGYHVTVLAWDRERQALPRETCDGIELRRIHLRSVHNRGPIQGLYMLAANLLMMWRGLRLRFDVVHAHDLDTLPAGFVLARLKRKPLIYDSHEDYPGMLHDVVPGWATSMISRVESFLARRADLLITVGELLRRDFEGRGCRRSVVVGNWKRKDEFRLGAEVRDEVRRRLNISDSALVVCFLGSLGYERMLRPLLEAVASRPEVHLIIGGTGPELPTIEDYARRYANIHYVGFLDPPGLRANTSASDVIYIGMDTNNPNSRYTAPNKLFEAMASGKAVISGHFGEVQHIVSDTGCGLLIENFSASEIARALDTCHDKQLVAQWQNKARIAGETTYMWEAAERRLLAAYEELLRGK